MDKVTSCPVETTIGVIGGRWKVLIIHCLIKKTMRFGEIARVLDGISARSLSKQLRELEEDGVIVRKDFEEALPRVEYSLTTLGQSLESVLLAMEAWGIRVEETRRRCT